MCSSRNSNPRILIAGFGRLYRAELAEAFQEQGFLASVTADLRTAADRLIHEAPDAVLLNWSLRPPVTTAEFIQRHAGLVPVLVLSANSRLIDVVQSLRAGAADYIRAPCYFPEILARVERAQAAAPAPKLSVGALSLDVAGGIARIGDEIVQMTTREARILGALMQCVEAAIGRETIMRVAGITDAKPAIIESYIKQLRGRHPLLRRWVRTSYGRGYLLLPD